MRQVLQNRPYTTSYVFNLLRETLQKIARALQQRIITNQTKVTKVKRAEGGTFEINCLSLPVFEIVESA